MTSLTVEIRTRLSEYLRDSSKSEEFHSWFSEVLRMVHADNEAEPLARAIEWAFLDAERGLAPDLVKQNLRQLAQSVGQSTVTARAMVVGCATPRLGDDGTSSTLLFVECAPQQSASLNL